MGADLVRRFIEACRGTRTILPATTTIERRWPRRASGARPRRRAEADRRTEPPGSSPATGGPTAPAAGARRGRRPSSSSTCPTGHGVAAAAARSEAVAFERGRRPAALDVLHTSTKAPRPDGGHGDGLPPSRAGGPRRPSPSAPPSESRAPRDVWRHVDDSSLATAGPPGPPSLECPAPSTRASPRGSCSGERSPRIRVSVRDREDLIRVTARWSPRR